MLTALAGSSACGGRLSTITLEERAPVPPSVWKRYAFGIVRRGVLVRERRSGEGARTAVDVAGRGAYVPLSLAPGCTAYAASRVLLCVYREASLDGISGEHGTAIDLMKLANETLQRVERIADARGRTAAAERIEALLDTLQDCLAPHESADLLQRDLAALLGLRTETVCRVLRARRA